MTGRPAIWRLARWGRSIARLAERNLIVEWAARLGYAARGAVYLSVGVIALLAALRLIPHAAGTMDALRIWANWPIGIMLLWIIGTGLCAFAFWRALQSVVDIERLGRRPKALATRLGKAVSGVLYGSLGIAVLRLLDTWRDLRRSNDQADTEATIRSVLSLPFGRTLVIAFGAVLLAVGVGNMVRALVDHFTGSLRFASLWKAPVGLLARIGYFARGVAFLPAGWFAMKAGWH